MRFIYNSLAPRLLLALVLPLLMSGCGTLVKENSFQVDRANKDPNVALSCANPGKDGDPIEVAGQVVYLENSVSFAMTGPPFVPLIPISVSGRLDKLMLIFEGASRVDPANWRVRFDGDTEWLVGEWDEEAADPRIVFSFPIRPAPESLDLEVTDPTDKKKITLKLMRKGKWSYIPLMGLQGEKVAGWRPQCGD